MQTGRAIWTGGKCSECGSFHPMHKPDCPLKDVLVPEPGREFTCPDPDPNAPVYKPKEKHG